MKIRCEYCSSMFDDTLEKCPSCGAPNQNVRRSTVDQPTTIEGLKEWYESKGLPPYETTRFFIGVDYRRPRAFGIYKDENTGNFIVYKNKDNGQRAVRYEGSDEAYAVNELFMRLKQEILEQKARNASSSSRSYSPSDAQNYYDNYNARRGHHTIGNPSRKGNNRLVKYVLLILGVYFFAQFFGSMVLMVFSSDTIINQLKSSGLPAKGYYSYNGDTYYSFGRSSLVEEGKRWCVYDTANGEWELADVSSIPEFKKDRNAKDYFLSEGYDSDYAFPDIASTRVYYDNMYKSGYVTRGYYSYNDNEYYRLDSDDSSSWYIYSHENDEWEKLSYSDIPDALTNQYDARDFYYLPVWNSDTQITDFTDTEYYASYEREKEAIRESQSSDSWSSSDSSDYSWSSSDSWDSGSSDWSSDW